MALSSTKFFAINQPSPGSSKNRAPPPLCTSDSSSSAASDGRERRRDLDEARDPGDAVVLDCVHGVLDGWQKGAPRPGARRAASSASASVNPTGSHMMLSLPNVAVTCKRLSLPRQPD
ncbi:hypothetical protein VPH35_118675 [Triticum aestivum]